MLSLGVQARIRYLLSILLYFICCYFCAKFTILGLGEVASSKKVLPVFLLLTFLCSSRKTYLSLVLPLLIAISIYAPVGIEFGPPNLQGAISLYATDFEEATAFLSLIGWLTYVKALLIVLLSYVAYKISFVSNVKPWKNKVFVLIAIFVLVWIVKPTKFLSHLTKANEDMQESLAQMEKYVNKSSWTDVTTNSRNTDYILVIGESARRDYFHVYGYPVSNTPFLDKVPATFVNGLSSGGVYTIGSLRLMLTHGKQNQWEPRYDFNLIDLTNASGINTTWISNQGFVGRWDTPISSIGVRAQKNIFPNSQGYEQSRLSDYRLLNFLSSELKREKDKSHLYVLHTIGSHPNACSKLDDLEEPYKVSNSSLDYVACYVSTIKKTDVFLSKLYELMNENYKSSGRKFSIIYFSDHGQCHVEREGKIVINNNTVSKYHYDIPLIRIDSDGVERRWLDSKKSGLLFTAGLAHWMGIETPQLPVYDLFDGVDDQEDFGLSEKIKQITTPDDPAIDISDCLIK